MDGTPAALLSVACKCRLRQEIAGLTLHPEHNDRAGSNPPCLSHLCLSDYSAAQRTAQCVSSIPALLQSYGNYLPEVQHPMPARASPNTAWPWGCTLRTGHLSFCYLQEQHTAFLLEPATEAAEFSWAKHWYGVGAAHNLDPTRPHALTLLGKNLVLWKDSSTGQWNCLEDRCPHRAAPLSG